MKWNESDIEVVRKVADEMLRSDREVVMPGWDPDRKGEHKDDADIRTAAIVLLNSLSMNEGIPVPEKALGALLRYVVDILEP